MPFDADTYFAAAGERIAEAQDLYAARRYVLCHYAAGLAVECLLRAYRFRRRPEFDSRHDLYALYDGSGLAERIPARQTFAANAALAVVAQRWANDHRFRSAASLRRRLKRAGLDRGIRGDFLKEKARRILEAAGEFVRLGTRLWHRS